MNQELINRLMQAMGDDYDLESTCKFSNSSDFKVAGVYDGNYCRVEVLTNGETFCLKAEDVGFSCPHIPVAIRLAEIIAKLGIATVMPLCQGLGVTAGLYGTTVTIEHRDEKDPKFYIVDSGGSSKRILIVKNDFTWAHRLARELHNGNIDWL